MVMHNGNAHLTPINSRSGDSEGEAPAPPNRHQSGEPPICVKSVATRVENHPF